MIIRTAAFLGTLACTALPGAFAVDFEVNEDTTLSVFGEFNYLYLIDEQRLVAECTPAPCEPDVKGVNELVDNGSKFGVAGEFSLENGLTAYFFADWEFSADEDPGENGGGLSATDESYIGLTGNFGTTQLGNADGIYDDVILDVLDNFEYEGPTEYKFSSEAGDLLSYESPDLANFYFAIQTSIKGNGAVIDEDEPPDPASADAVYPLMLTAMYETEGFSIRLGYDDRRLVSDDAEPQIGLAATLDLDPFELGVKFETIGESSKDEDDGVQLAGIIATFDYEVGEASLAVQNITYDTEDTNQSIDFDTEIADLREDRTEAVFYANYILNRNILFYFEAAAYGATQNFGDYVGLGTVFEY